MIVHNGKFVAYDEIIGLLDLLKHALVIVGFDPHIESSIVQEKDLELMVKLNGFLLRRTSDK